MVHDVGRGKIHAIAGIGGCRLYEIDRGAFGDCARPLSVNVCFGLVVISPRANRPWVAGVRILSDRQMRSWEAKYAPKISIVLWIDVRLSYHCDGHSRTVVVRCPSWQHVIDRGEIGRAHSEAIV